MQKDNSISANLVTTQQIFDIVNIDDMLSTAFT